MGHQQQGTIRICLNLPTDMLQTIDRVSKRTPDFGRCAFVRAAIFELRMSQKDEIEAHDVRRLRWRGQENSRISLDLPVWLAKDLAREVKRRHCSRSNLIRKAIDVRITKEQKRGNR